ADGVHPVARHDDLVEGQVRPPVQDAAAGGDGAEVTGNAVGGLAVGDGQVLDRHVGGGAADAEDPAGAPAADGDLLGAGAFDGQVVGDVQLARGQGDGAAQVVGEADQVRPGVGVGGADGGPQRAGAAVGEFGHGVGAGDRPVLQALQAKQERP